VEKIENYTRNEWRRLKTTLETSGEDARLNLQENGLKDHAKNGATKHPRTPTNTHQEAKPTLETSGGDVKLHSKRVEKM
jgi:hypothetical protein